jgi:hypothetical protein
MRLPATSVNFKGAIVPIRGTAWAIVSELRQVDVCTKSEAGNITVSEFTDRSTPARVPHAVHPLAIVAPHSSGLTSRACREKSQ